MDSYGRFMKYFLFAVNLIIFIIATAIIIISVWGLIKMPEWVKQKFPDSKLNVFVINLLIVGMILLSIAIFGIIAALQKVKCMLLTYAIIVFLLFVITIIGTVLHCIHYNENNKSLEKTMTNLLKRYYNDRESTRTFWDKWQPELQCCGVNSWKDWETHGLKVPASCCMYSQLFNRTSHCNGNRNIYTEGCINKLEGQYSINIVNGSTIPFICLTFFGIISSCMLYKKLKNQQNILHEAGPNNQDPESVGLQNL